MAFQNFHTGLTKAYINVYFATTILRPNLANCIVKWWTSNMQYKCVVCSVQCSMWSMKCTGAVAGAFAGAGTVCSVHCAVCSVQCPACQGQRLRTSNLISLIKYSLNWPTGPIQWKFSKIWSAKYLPVTCRTLHTAQCTVYTTHSTCTCKCTCYCTWTLHTSHWALHTAHRTFILHVAHLSLHTADSQKLAELGLKMVVAKLAFI